MRGSEVDLRGRAAYEAYCACFGNRSAVSGEELPSWDEQRPDIREAWRAAADAAVMVTQARMIDVSGVDKRPGTEFVRGDPE